ncbi:hypothetical protein ACFL04_00970 [Patescibacteria group bacterium]
MDEQSESKPDKPEEEKPKKKSKKKWIWISIILFIFVILPLLAIGYTGLFNIPGLTHLFGSHKPIDLGVEISDEAITSGLAKTPWKLSELPTPPSTSPLEVDRVYTGSVPVTNDVTSEEFSSFVNDRFQNSGVFESIQVRFYDGGAEASFKLNEFISSPIYIKSDITTTKDKTLSFDVKQIKIGRLPIPQNFVQQFEEAATELVSDRMSLVEGFSIERLIFKDNFVDFKGTYPETIELVE